MFSLFTKKKLSEDTLANVFVNAIIDVSENGWKELAPVINNDPSFVSCPNLSEDNCDKFLMIVLTSNLKFLPKYFDAEQGNRIKFLIIEKAARAFGMEEETLYQYIKDYDLFMSRVNHPSKNVLYAMSKAVFFKYNLTNFQDDYFKDLKTPNPLFLKRMDEAMKNFIWDWETWMEKVKVAA